jgi:hypothetical protein
VNFDGTTSGIRSSGNVSSITNNGLGNYTINFSTGMPDANYAVSGWAGAGTGTGITSGYIFSSPDASNPRSASSVQVGTWAVGNGHLLRNVTQVNAAIFR